MIATVVVEKRISNKIYKSYVKVSVNIGVPWKHAVMSQ